MPSGDCEEGKETQDADEGSGLTCSLPAMRIFNAVAPLLGETAPQNTAE
jgi:D-alanyl-D-alanine carboxypeptidase